MMRAKREETGEFRSSAFRLSLTAIIMLLTAIYLINVFVYPETQIVPTDLFFALAIVQIFLLWLDEVREKRFQLWAQKKRDELGEMKSKFTVITSHELMTPITVLKGYVELLAQGAWGKVTDEQKRSLDTMLRHINRLEDIKATLSKLYVGSPFAVSKERRLHALPVLIQEVVADVMPFVRKRRQTITFETAPLLPPLMISAGDIRQVLMHLILNAVRFTPDGGRIALRVRDAGADVAVEVEDTGIGIPADKLQIIFEEFYEVGDVYTHHSGGVEFRSAGMGLGLAIARRIITAHRGTIRAESEVGRYTRLIFTLPKTA